MQFDIKVVESIFTKKNDALILFTEDSQSETNQLFNSLAIHFRGVVKFLIANSKDKVIFSKLGEFFGLTILDVPTLMIF